MSYPNAELIYNRAHNGMLTEERNTTGGGIAYFEGGKASPGVLEARQWLDAISKDTEPLILIVSDLQQSVKSGKI